MARLAEVTKELTIDEVHELREELLSLSQALKTVPSEYDASFQQKINRVLDITSEVEHHTRKLRNELEESQRSFNQSQGEQQTQFHEAIGKQITARHEQQLGFIEKKINDTLSGNKRFLFVNTLVTSLLTGATIGATFYLLAFAF